jgi:hypothetical protein
MDLLVYAMKNELMDRMLSIVGCSLPPSYSMSYIRFHMQTLFNNHSIGYGFDLIKSKTKRFVSWRRIFVVTSKILFCFLLFIGSFHYNTHA